MLQCCNHFKTISEKYRLLKCVQTNFKNVNDYNMIRNEVATIILGYHYIVLFHILFLLINYFRWLHAFFIQFLNNNGKQNSMYIIVDLTDTMRWCVHQNTKPYAQKYLVTLFYSSWINLSIVSCDTYQCSITFWNAQGKQSGKCIFFDSNNTMFSIITPVCFKLVH